MASGRFDEERAKIHISLSLTQSEARELLDQLAQDGHEFRNELESDPRSALKKLPIEITGVRLPEHIKLPDPSHFRKLLARIEENDFADPSVPAGYVLFMMVLPFACPTGK